MHATIANHDLLTGKDIAHGTDHATVKRKNDQLSREMGFTVVGPAPAKERTTWAERKEQFGIESFERVLGNRVEDARNHASSMEEFREELKARDVELTETHKMDKETGEETVGWSYKARDPYGKRRRRASNLADDLTKEGVEAYFEEKQRQAEAQAEARSEPEPTPAQDAEPEAVTDEPTYLEHQDSPSDPSFGTYFVTESDVGQMAGDLQMAHIGRCREQGKPFANERYDRLMEVKRHPDEQLARLREEVDAEKRLKAAEKALGGEDEREKRRKTGRYVRAAEMHFGHVTHSQAEDDVQYQ